MRPVPTLPSLNTAAVDEGTDLGSNSVVPVNAPRVALLGDAPVNGNSYGFAWFQFDQRLGYPAAGVSASAVAGGILSEFDVLVMPSASAGGLGGALGERGHERAATLGAARRRAHHHRGRNRLAGQRALGADRRSAPAPAARDSGAAGAPLPVNNPGAIVRTLPTRSRRCSPACMTRNGRCR